MRTVSVSRQATHSTGRLAPEECMIRPVIDRPIPKSDHMTTFPAPRPRGKLPARYAAIVMPLVLSVLMTFVVSAISTLKSLGPTSAFITTWPAAWAISWLVAFPTLLALLPLVRKIVALAVQQPT